MEITKVLGTVAMVPKGEYDAEEYYEYLNVVTYNYSSYIAKKASSGILPTNDEYWQLVAKTNLDIIYDEINEALYLTIIGNIDYNEQNEELVFEVV